MLTEGDIFVKKKMIKFINKDNSKTHIELDRKDNIIYVKFYELDKIFEHKQNDIFPFNIAFICEHRNFDIFYRLNNPFIKMIISIHQPDTPDASLYYINVNKYMRTLNIDDIKLINKPINNSISKKTNKQIVDYIQQDFIAHAEKYVLNFLEIMTVYKGL